MRNRLLASAAIMALSMGTAFAADLPSRKDAPVYVEPAFSWTGFYLGAHVGGDFGSSSWTDPNGNLPGPPETSSNFNNKLSTSGFIYGGQIGYNYEFASKFLLGVEGEIWGSTLSGSRNVGGEGSSARSTFAGDIALRGGYAFDRALVYGKVGYAFADYRYKMWDSFGGWDVAKATQSGLLLGLGLEYALNDRWSVKLEYDHIGYGNRSAAWYYSGGFDFNTTKFADNENIVKLGVNYHFGEPAPVVAKY